MLTSKPCVETLVTDNTQQPPPELPTDILHFCPQCEPEGLAEQNIQVYVPGDDNRPESLQADETQVTDKTPSLVVSDNTITTTVQDNLVEGKEIKISRLRIDTE